MLPADNILDVPPSHSFASSNMSAKTELGLLDKIMKVGMGFVLPPIIITILSLYTYFQIRNQILLLCPVISIISLSATIFLIYYSKEAKNLNLQVSNKMFVCLYVIHFCAAAYFFIGFLLIFLFKGEKELLSKVNFALLGIEGGGIKYIIGYGLLFLLIRRLTIEYQNISQYIQVMQILLTICGAGIFLTCESYKNRWDNLDLSYHIQPIILTLGTIAGLGTILLSLITFYGSYTEKFSILLLSQILNVILMIFLLMLTGILNKSNGIYTGVIHENCDFLLKIMDYRKLKCQKYIEGECEEEFLANSWESGIEKGEKCVNKTCCWEITEEVVLSLQVCMAWTLLTAVLLGFSWFTCQGLVKKIEKFGRSTEKNFDYKVMVILILIYLLTGSCWVFLDNSARLEKNSAKVQVIDAEIISSKFFPHSPCRKLEISIEFPELFDNLLLTSKNGKLYPSSLSGKTKNIQESLKSLNFCPNYISQTYQIEANFEKNNELQNSTTFIIQESIQYYEQITGKSEGITQLLPNFMLDPSTTMILNSSYYSFSAPHLAYAYRLSVLFDQYPVSYTIGGLYPTIPNIFLPPLSENFTLSIKTFNPSEIELYEGLNSLNTLILSAHYESGLNTIQLPSGLYTLISKSIGQVSYKANINLSKPTEVEILSFPTLMNEAFSIQFIRNSSRLFSHFELDPESFCELSLKSPRCGGARMLKYKSSEIFKVSEVSASYYLIYAVGNDFSEEKVKFYSKGHLQEHFEVYGKKDLGKVWLILCVNGRMGINSVNVLDVYVENVDFEACHKVYGNLTWDEKEIKKGYIKVGD